MIGFLVARISKSKTLVKLFRAVVSLVPMPDSVTKALLGRALPETRWTLNSRELEILNLLAQTRRCDKN